MSQALEPYYERELTFFAELARSFARRYPAEAGSLAGDAGQGNDPHADRLVEAFALLAGRVRHKIDTEFPQLTEALLAVLYPHLLAPVPSLAVAQFTPDAGAERKLGRGLQVPRQFRLASAPVGEPPLPCRWRTAYPVTLWPVRLAEALWQSAPLPYDLAPPPGTAAVLRLRLECTGGHRFAGLGLDRLRFHLSGDRHVLANLYEVLFNHTLRVVFRPLDEDARAEPVTLAPADCLHQVGFGSDEGLLAFPCESFVGYRLLTEFFSFPAKFHFLELGGWEQVWRRDFGRQVEVLLFLNRTHENLEQGVNAQTFQLGCTPIINLFSRSADPIALTQTRYEYRVVPCRSAPLAMEVHTVEDVSAYDPDTGATTHYQPFYAFSHGQTRHSQRAFWYASRRPAPPEIGKGTEVYLVLVDGDFDPWRPAEAVLNVHTTCSNGSLPTRHLGPGSELFPEGRNLPAGATARLLRAPTPPLRPPLRSAAHWRLLSQNALNHVSLADPEVGRAALQEILQLSDLADAEAGQQQLAAVNRQMIEGITNLRSRRVLGRVRSPQGIGCCRGVEFTVELDPQKYVGTGMFLFASVLERFLGLYASVNSFSQLVARTKEGKGYLKKWPPRAADRQLL